MFCGFNENWECTILNYFQASLLGRFNMASSTSLYEWYHVTCSIIFRNINNLCSIRVIGKHLNFLYAINILPLPLSGLYQACWQVLHPIKFSYSLWYNKKKFGHILILWYPRPRGFIMNFACIQKRSSITYEIYIEY